MVLFVIGLFIGAVIGFLGLALCVARKNTVDKFEFLVYRKCKLCGKHFARCRCKTPIWTTNLGDKYLPEEFLR